MRFLPPLETLGVLVVGLLMAYGTRKVAKVVGAPAWAGLLGGAALYTVGVIIGANRPAAGWLPRQLTAS